LLKEFGFTEFTESEIHQSIRSFCSFAARAEAHYSVGNNDEGFLHHVIALELVLGNEDELAKSISTRLAVLSHEQLGITYQQALSITRRAYDVRSKYVHEGKHLVTLELVSTIRQMVRSVLTALLRIQADVPTQGFLRSSWLAELDFLALSLGLGKSIDREQWSSVGVTKGQQIR
jgi:hypothetical protein